MAGNQTYLHRTKIPRADEAGLKHRVRVCRTYRGAVVIYDTGGLSLDVECEFEEDAKDISAMAFLGILSLCLLSA
jgi:hypothetical protein